MPHHRQPSLLSTTAVHTQWKTQLAYWLEGLKDHGDTQPSALLLDDLEEAITATSASLGPTVTVDAIESQFADLSTRVRDAERELLELADSGRDSIEATILALNGDA